MGVKLVAVASDQADASDFAENVWKGEELYFDATQNMKVAMGEHKVNNWRVLQPTVLFRAIGSAFSVGSKSSDINERTNLRGGELIVHNGAIVYERPEGRNFDHASPDILLEQCALLVGRGMSKK